MRKGKNALWAFCGDADKDDPDSQLLTRRSTMRTGQSVIGSILGLSLVLAWGIASPNTARADWTGNVNVSLGMKALNEDDWTPVENQSEFAIEWDFRDRSWPVNAIVGLRGSYDEAEDLGFTLEGKTSELSLGARKIWDSFPHMRPFIGGGLSMMNAEIEVLGVSVSDSAPGLWLGGGVYWALTPHFNLGFDLRFSRATVTLAGVDGEAGGNHLGLLLGYHY